MMQPCDADALWRNRAWIRRATDVYKHPVYRHASQTTRVFGRTLLDELETYGGVDGLFSRVCELTELAPAAFACRVPPVELKRVPKLKWPTDMRAGDDVICPENLAPTEWRTIVLPPLLRRALSAHVARILTATSDHLLPANAVAYRPGRVQVVRRGILDVARAIRGGCRFWAKEDVRSFFQSVPWKGIERSLLAIGYSGAFTEVIMALVRGRLEEAVGWRIWLHVDNESGAQAGLPESAILANVFLSELDRRLLARLGQRAFFRRYSDDLILMAPTKTVVRRAVADLRRWIEACGMRLKETGT